MAGFQRPRWCFPAIRCMAPRRANPVWLVIPIVGRSFWIFMVCGWGAAGAACLGEFFGGVVYLPGGMGGGVDRVVGHGLRDELARGRWCGRAEDDGFHRFAVAGAAGNGLALELDDFQAHGGDTDIELDFGFHKLTNRDGLAAGEFGAKGFGHIVQRRAGVHLRPNPFTACLTK